jgi:site-specific DNA-methyltransferase (adenine-specific)
MIIDVRHGDSTAIMATLDADSVDAVVTDPPYGFRLMNRHWDHGVPGVDAWAQALRVAKPGAHLLAFGGTRTVHRLAVAIEDAGWDIRDMLMWIHGSGFPKSHASLKPAVEPIIMARKPLRGTVATNGAAYGTGALQIDACRNGERWPANVLHDGSDIATSGMGDAARYFYCAKAQRADRDDGCDDLPLRRSSGIEARNRESGLGQFDGPTPMGHNHHPTVKPTALMTWLCQLVTPPGGVVLDPFCGSGSTGRGAIAAGAGRFVGIDQDEEYCEIARRRVAAMLRPMDYMETSCES